MSHTTRRPFLWAWTTLLSLALIGLLTGCVSAQDPNWITDGSMSYAFITTKYSYNSARQQCKDYGGDLAMITSDEINTFIIENIPSAESFSCGSRYWIGLKRAGDSFSWVNGDPLDYTNWYSRQPNNAGRREDCVGIVLSDSDKSWDDNMCSYSVCSVCARSIEEQKSQFKFWASILIADPEVQLKITEIEEPLPEAVNGELQEGGLQDLFAVNVQLDPDFQISPETALDPLRGMADPSTSRRKRSSPPVEKNEREVISGQRRVIIELSKLMDRLSTTNNSVSAPLVGSEGCTPNPCENGAPCVVSDIDGSPYCQCPTDPENLYYGENCSLSESNSDACSETVYEKSGSITSPNHPGNYEARQNCNYLVGWPGAKKVRISFNEVPILLEESKDELVIGNGSVLDISRTDILRYSALYTTPPADFEIDGDTFWANFYSDKNNQFSGFNLTWLFDGNECDGNPCSSNETCQDMEYDFTCLANPLTADNSTTSSPTTSSTSGSTVPSTAPSTTQSTTLATTKTTTKKVVVQPPVAGSGSESGSNESR